MASAARLTAVHAALPPTLLAGSALLTALLTVSAWRAERPFGAAGWLARPMQAVAVVVVLACHPICAFERNPYAKLHRARPLMMEVAEPAACALLSLISAISLRRLARSAVDWWANCHALTTHHLII